LEQLVFHQKNKFIGTNIITTFAGTGSPNYNSENILELTANICRYENAFVVILLL
jgi:hypothetical protein